jgi:hypothetical protein
MKTLKLTLFPLLSFLMMISCKNSQEDIIPSITVQEGIYRIKIYDSSGKLVLTREGEADYTGHNNSITLIDPDFGKLGFGDYFSGLHLTHKKNQNNENYFTKGLFNEKEIIAYINSAWYIIPEKDWGYGLTKGSLQIIDISKENIKGFAKFEMKNDSSWLKGENSKWGDNIKIEAEFFAN